MIERDSGLQPERTSLAWFRTILVLAANALLLFKVGEMHGFYFLVAMAAIVLCMAGFLLAYNRRRFGGSLDLAKIVTNKDLIYKRCLSFIVGIAAISYAVFLCSELYLETLR